MIAGTLTLRFASGLGQTQFTGTGGALTGPAGNGCKVVADRNDKAYNANHLSKADALSNGPDKEGNDCNEADFFGGLHGTLLGSLSLVRSRWPGPSGTRHGSYCVRGPTGEALADTELILRTNADRHLYRDRPDIRVKTNAKGVATFSWPVGVDRLQVVARNTGSGTTGTFLFPKGMVDHLTSLRFFPFWQHRGQRPRGFSNPGPPFGCVIGPTASSAWRWSMRMESSASARCRRGHGGWSRGKSAWRGGRVSVAPAST